MALAHRQALKIAQELAQILAPACDKIAIAGSVRRQKANPNDIEIVAIPRLFDGANALLWLLDQLLEAEDIQPPERKCWGKKHRKFFFQAIKIDLFTADEHSWGYQYWLRTGPGNANEAVMKACWQKNSPWKAKGGYLWHGDDKLHVPDEESMFALLGFPYINPEMRTRERYRRLFSVPQHQWGTEFHRIKNILPVEEPKPEAPQQMEMFDLNALCNEHYGDDGVKKAKAPEPPYQWEKPFLTESGHIWVDMGYGDWSIYERFHPRVREMLKYYQQKPMQRESTIKRLRTFQGLLQARAKSLYWEAEAFDLLGYYEEEFRSYIKADWHDGPKYEQIDIEKITPTQNIVIRRHLETWAERIAKGRFMGDADDLPVAMKFRDDERYFLTDGHHRYFVAKSISCLSYLPCYVDYVDMDLKEALAGYHSKYQSTTGTVHMGFVNPDLYELEDSKIYPVPVNKLIGTMEDVEVVYVDQYYESEDEYDADGNLAQVIECADGMYILLDGHHRLEAARMRQKKSLLASVATTSMCSRQARVEDNYDELQVADLLTKLHAAYLEDKKNAETVHAQN